MNDFEKMDTYRGYKYAIWLNTRQGYRCGYVEIPEGHPLYETVYYDLDIDAVPLTFGGKFKSVPGFWLGWDHNHLWDAADEDVIYKYHPDKAEEYVEFARSLHDGYGIVYSMEMVEKECQDLIDEIIQKYDNKGE